MSVFNNNMDNYIEIDHRPALIQTDGGKINPELADYIYRGEPCDYDSSLHTALEKNINDKCKTLNILALILTIIAVVILVSDFLPILGVVSIMLFSQGLPMNILIGMLLFLIGPPLLSLLFFVIARSIRNSTSLYKVVLQAARAGQVTCYRYRFRGYLCYRDTSNEAPSYDYYANLGDFAVSLSKPPKISPCYDVKAVVIPIKEESYFFFIG